MEKLISFFRLCFCLAILWAASFYFAASVSSVESSNIIINEIGACERSGYEWIEIYNRGEDPIDISGWYFWEGVTASNPDGTNHKLILYQGDDMVVNAGEFVIIAQNADRTKKEYPDLMSKIIDSSWGSLKESGEKIAIKDSGKNIVESFTYIPCSEHSIERVNFFLDDYSLNNWRESESENTIGRPNSESIYHQDDSERKGKDIAGNE